MIKIAQYIIIVANICYVNTITKAIIFSNGVTVCLKEGEFAKFLEELDLYFKLEVVLSTTIETRGDGGNGL